MGTQECGLKWNHHVTVQLPMHVCLTSLKVAELLSRTAGDGGLRER